MIEGLRPYPEFASTEVGWLPQLPPHWQVMRSKHVFREVDCRSVDGAETHLSMHQKLGLVPSAITGEKRLVSESYAGGKVVEPNDLVLNRLKAHLGVFAHASQQGVISPDYTVLRPLPNAAVRYYEYLLKSPACRGELRIRIKGIVEGFWRLYTDDFYDVRLPVPPLDEQQLIVRFLDWHGAMTGKLIRAKRRLIALLNEQKQSIIHRAVTRGLDPAAKLKPSGVDWLGDVPEHWEVVPARWLFEQRNERGLAGADMLSVTIAKGIIKQAELLEDSSKKDASREDKSSYKVVREGDIAYNKMRAWQGAFGHSDYDGIVSPAYIVLKPLADACSKYFHFLFRTPTFAKEAERWSYGIASDMWSLRPEDFRMIRLPKPAIAEQFEIVSLIAKETAKIERALDGAANEIALIQEFRTRLIADVVTGQLDVRAVAANLPDIAEADATDLTDDDDLDDDADDLIDEEEAA
jgi:type I restriction enzyme S subunit